MPNFISLPTESIVCILRFLPPADIRTCKLLSHYLLATIQASIELQYLLELDSLGFVPPFNPLDSLTVTQKVLALREKHLVTTDQTQRNLGAHKYNLTFDERLISCIRYSRGVLAIGSPFIDGIQQLQLYRLASRNKNTERSSSVLDLGISASDYRFDPDLDILVLLESTAAQVDDSNHEIRLHFRSLSTGLAHPLASIPIIIHNTSDLIIYHEAGFQIVGHLLAIMCRKQPPAKDSSDMYIWDWTTGELVASMTISGVDFVFISKDTFLTTISRRAWSNFDTIGYLEVYTIAGITPGSPAERIASLELPSSMNGSCHSSCYFTTPPPLPTPPITHGFLKAMTPKRIYEIGPDYHYLSLRIRVNNIETLPSWASADGLLFIPPSAIQWILDDRLANPLQLVRSIPWEDWARGSGASWLNMTGMSWGPYHAFSNRVALLSQDYDNEEKRRVFLFNLKATARGHTRNEQPRDPRGEPSPSNAYLNALFVNPELGVREPPIIASFLLSDEFQAPHAHIAQIIIDDEHIITYCLTISDLDLTDHYI